MTTKYLVKLSGEDEELVESVREDANIGNKEHFTKLALLMFAQIYMKKKDQMLEEVENEEGADTEGT